MKKRTALTVALAIGATPAFAGANLANDETAIRNDTQTLTVSGPRLAQAAAPGRPTTPAEQKEPAPNPPNRDPIAPREPPSPTVKK